MTRLPRLLDTNLAEVARLHPESMSVDLQLESVSTATMELAEDDAALKMHDFVEVFTPRGSAGIFRVTNIADTKRGTRTVTLMHAIDTLSDYVWREQEDYDGTVAGFLESLLAMQTVVRWQLGTVANGTDAWKKAGINYDRLSEMLEELQKDRFGYYFSYDFTTTPWTLNCLAQGTTVTSEFRLDRNVENCEITRDDGEMCNKLYLSVNTKNVTYEVTVNDEEIRTYNNAASQALYGIVEKTADIDMADVPDADAWAADFLAQRAHPAVQIAIDAFALQGITGESWDEARLGEMARVALPDYAEALEERVVTISYPDLIFDDPDAIERVTVQLANHTAKFSETISKMQKDQKKTARGGRSAGRGGASAGELENWAMVVTKHNEIMDETSLIEMWQSGIELDAQSGVRIWSLTQGFVSQHAEIQVHSDQIALVVTGGEYGHKVNVASIVAAINGDTSNIKITADSIVLDANMTTVGDILTGRTMAEKIMTDLIQTNKLDILTNGQLNIHGALNYGGTGVFWRSKNVLTSANSPVATQVERYFVYSTTSSITSVQDLRVERGYLVSSRSGGSGSSDTIYYLGGTPPST